MSERPKCGTCVSFEVRNRDEALLARIAKSEAECRPGEWVFRGERKVGCHGGPVRGACLRWQEIPIPHSTVESTSLCRLYEAGGPSVRGMGPIPPGGSFNRPTSESVSGTDRLISEMNGGWLALGLTAALSVVVSKLMRRDESSRMSDRLLELERAPLDPDWVRADAGELRRFGSLLQKVSREAGVEEPYLYLTPEGGAQGEWDLGEWSVSLTSGPSWRVVHAHASRGNDWSDQAIPASDVSRISGFLRNCRS